MTAAEACAKPARVLIVDDDSLFSHAMRKVCAMGAYEAEAASSAGEAKALLARQTFDVILLDISFRQGPDGISFLRELKSSPQSKDIPVLMVTGVADYEDIKTSLDLGAVDCLEKPVISDTLFFKIEEALESRKKAAVLGARRILYVEDDDGWAALVRSWMGERGWPLDRLKYRRELAGYFEKCETPPDCILMDVVLDDISGPELADRIKADLRLQAVPIVFLTGRQDKKLECLRHNGVSVVLKGKDARAELMATLDAVIRMREQARGIVTAGDLRLDPCDGRVFHRGELLCTLNDRYFSLLKTLLLHAPAPVPKRTLALTGDLRLTDRSLTSSLKSAMTALRAMLGREVGARIVSRRGVGYAYEAGPDLS